MQAFQYNDLRDIDEVSELHPSDYECLEAVKQVLIAHDKVERFGVNLLHRHFDVAEDECVVEYTDKAKRKLVAVVEKIGASNATETMWRFDVEENGTVAKKCRRYCWAGKDGHPQTHDEW